MLQVAVLSDDTANLHFDLRMAPNFIDYTAAHISNVHPASPICIPKKASDFANFSLMPLRWFSDLLQPEGIISIKDELNQLGCGFDIQLHRIPRNILCLQHSNLIDYYVASLPLVSPLCASSRHHACGP